MKTIKHFIWDFDGTLADSYPNLVRYLVSALADFNISSDSVEVLELMMENIPHAIRYFTERYDLPDLKQRYDYHYSIGKDDPILAFEVLRLCCNKYSKWVEKTTYIPIVE